MITMKRCDMDDEMTRLWKETKLIVEANSYERMTLWEKWADKTEWRQHRQGRLVLETYGLPLDDEAKAAVVPTGVLRDAALKAALGRLRGELEA